MPAQKPSSKQPDIEEIALGQFLVRDIRARPVLKGEGELRGQLFTLGTWRREGLLARLRDRGLSVSTLGDQIDALPPAPQHYELGQQLWHPLSGKLDHISRFDTQLLAWWQIEPMQRGNEQGVVVHANEPIRRRKGRGQTSFYRVHPTRSGSSLEPISETQALLWAYALALHADQRPLLAEAQAERILLPEIELPPPYRALLERVIGPYKGRPSSSQAAWPLVQALYAQLGLQLALVKES